MLRTPQKPMRSLVSLALSPVTGTLSYGASAIGVIGKSISTKALEAIDMERALALLEKRSPTIAEAISTIAAGTGGACGKIRALFSSAEMLAIRGRFSGAPSMKGLCAFLLMGTGGVFLADTGSPHPEDVPRYTATSIMDDDPLPGPNEPIEMIFWKLSTPQRFGRFLKKHVTHDSTKNPITTFHISPEEFQDSGFRGVCNNMARKYCECMERHGYTAYYANLIPKNVLETRPSTSHQIAFIRTDENIIWICDNLEVFPWRGSIEDYVSERHSAMQFAPWGIAQYRRPQENILSRSMMQLRAPQEIRICPLPEPKDVMVASN